MQEKEIKKVVQDRYSEIAKQGSTCCSCCDSCGPDMLQQAKRIGYSEKELQSIPEAAVMGLGCGNPTALVDLKEGETVLDLGAGAGIDVFLAANRVGPKGFVIGIDMTGEMIERAREIAEEARYSNVEFRRGEIENLPVENNSVDVIISNCVINLSPDKLRTYQEAYRVLKPGGRVLISDIITEGELPEEVKKNLKAWAGCVAGALERDEYLETIKKAGFKNISIVSQSTFSKPELDDTLVGKIVSVQIRAYK